MKFEPSLGRMITPAWPVEVGTQSGALGQSSGARDRLLMWIWVRSYSLLLFAFRMLRRFESEAKPEGNAGQ